MSVATAVSRVAELEALLSRATGTVPAVPAQGAQGGDFQSQLVQASAEATPAGGAAAPAGSYTGPGARTPFAAEIDAAARKYNLDPNLLRGLIRAESNFNPRAGSPAGAQGLTQLMPATARSLGVTNPFDPVQSIEGGAKYLRQQLDRFGGDVRKALAAYNAGPGAVQRYGGIPPYQETQHYVRRVMAYAAEYRGEGSQRAA